MLPSSVVSLAPVVTVIFGAGLLDRDATAGPLMAGSPSIGATALRAALAAAESGSAARDRDKTIMDVSSPKKSLAFGMRDGKFAPAPCLVFGVGSSTPLDGIVRGTRRETGEIGSRRASLTATPPLKNGPAVARREFSVGQPSRG